MNNLSSMDQWLRILEWGMQYTCCFSKRWWSTQANFTSNSLVNSVLILCMCFFYKGYIMVYESSTVAPIHLPVVHSIVPLNSWMSWLLCYLTWVKKLYPIARLDHILLALIINYFIRKTGKRQVLKEESIHQEREVLFAISTNTQS